MKHRRAKRKMTNKQATTIIISVLCAAALLIGLLVVIGPILGGNADPHAGHDHSSDLGDGHYEGDGHDHGNTGNTTAGSSNAKVKYQVYSNADKTYRVVFRDAGGKVLMEQDKIPKQPVREAVDADNGVYTAAWATGQGPNDYAQIFYNEKTGEVSQVIVAPRGYDSARVAYGSDDQTKIIVQDLFNKDAYYKEYALTDPDTSAKDIILGGKLQSDNKTVTVSYAGTDGKSHHINVPLYE